VLAIYLCKLEALKALLAWLNEGVLEHYDHGVRRRAQASVFGAIEWRSAAEGKHGGTRHHP
jgi:hypothetical protein